MACCTNCAVLRERIHELERELGLRTQGNGAAILRQELDLQPMAARAVLILYQAKGRFVSTEALISLAGFSSYENMRTRFSRVRLIHGKDFIQSSWGQGYRLGPEAMERVARALALA